MSDTPRTDAATFPSAARDDQPVVHQEFARQLEREIAVKQALIDRLMLECCPEEMTAQQKEEWARNQKCLAPASTGKS